MLWFELKSSRVRAGPLKSWVWTSPDGAGVSADMDDADAIDPDLIDLIIQLCTRIGMIMEDVSPLAIAATSDGLAARAEEVVRAIRTLAALAHAVEALLQR
jgi:hypothetical protein